MGYFTTPRLLPAARVRVSAGFYRSCRDCRELFAPVYTDERRCPACVAKRTLAVAHGDAPLPN